MGFLLRCPASYAMIRTGKEEVQTLLFCSDSLSHSLLSLTAQSRDKSQAQSVKRAGRNQQSQQGECQRRQVGRGGSPRKGNIWSASEVHDTGHWGEISRAPGTGTRKKKRVESSPFPLLLLAPCSAASAPRHPTGKKRHCWWAWSLPAQLQPGLWRVWVFRVWHFTKQQETVRFQLKRKMGNAPQRWPLNEERHLNF